jgi:Transposase DDE domain
MDRIQLWARNGEAVRQALELGEIIHLDTASEELTDEFLLFALESGLLEQWAKAFPDPRICPEIGPEVILAASIAARFAGLYSMRKTGYVLRSARVLGALGYSVAVVEPGEGLSRRGTSDDAPLSGDSIRKLLVKMEQSVELPMPTPQLGTGSPPGVKVRQRASRREVKKAVDKVDSEARAVKVAQQLMDWYNQSAAREMLQYAQLGAGRRIHIVDTTRIEVALETDTYECSGVVRNEDGTYSRGYKLATLRTLLDTAGLLSAVELGPIQVHDLELCRYLLKTSEVLRAGDLLLEDRGFLDGPTITDLKQRRRVDIIVPLKSDMLAYQEAVSLAEMAGQWQVHPSRVEQQIALVRGVEHVWDGCEVQLNACVIRFYNHKKRCLDYIGLVTTDLELSAKWIVRHYEERPEVEQDYEQMKSGGWLLEKLASTRYSEIVYYLLTVVLSYSLYHLFANTQAGARFAHKTRQAIALEQLRTHRTHVIVYASGYFELFETLSFVRLVLQLSVAVQQRLRRWLGEHLDRINQRE